MYAFNLWLVSVMKVLMQQKKKFKRALFSAINPNCSSHKDKTNSHFLPNIKLTIPGNLTSAFYTLNILQTIHYTLLRRGFIFVTVIVLVYSLQFFYICIRVIFMKNKILSIGGPIFIAYTLFDFIVIMCIFFNILKNGADANECDIEFKEHLV